MSHGLYKCTRLAELVQITTNITHFTDDKKHHSKQYKK